MPHQPTLKSSFKTHSISRKGILLALIKNIGNYLLAMICFTILGKQPSLMTISQKHIRNQGTMKTTEKSDIQSFN